MKFTLPITIDIDPKEWRGEYGLATDAEAITHMRESFQYAAHENWAPLALVQAWPVLRDLATITAGAPYTADDHDAAVTALVATYGLNTVRRAVADLVAKDSDAVIARAVKAALSTKGWGGDDEVIAVTFETMQFDNGHFLYDGSATAHFANGESDEFDVDDPDLNSALNPDGPCAPDARLVIEVSTGTVEFDQDGSNIDATVERWQLETATYPEHRNDLDDWCPWSGKPSGGDDGCPAMCPASYADADEDEDEDTD